MQNKYGIISLVSSVLCFVQAFIMKKSFLEYLFNYVLVKDSPFLNKAFDPLNLVFIIVSLWMAGIAFKRNESKVFPIGSLVIVIFFWAIISIYGAYLDSWRHAVL